MNKEKILNEVKKKYEIYNIETGIMNQYIEETMPNYENEKDVIKKISILLDSYIVKSNNYADIIKINYAYLKKIILLDNSNLSRITLLANTHKVSIDNKLDEIYNYIIDNIENNYDHNKLLSQNILENIKKLLKENNDIKIDKNEEFDITFLRRLNGVNIEKLSKNTNISTSTLYGYINLGKKVPGYNLVLILEYFNVKTYDELKKIAIKKRYISEVLNKNIKEEEKNKYDISFLKSYLLKNKVVVVKLQIMLSLNKKQLDKCLNAEEFIDDEAMNILYKLFNIDNYNEFKNMVKENKLQIPSKLKPDNYDISFLNKFIMKNDIDKAKLANFLDIEVTTLNDYLNSKKLTPTKVVDKILEIFNLINYSDLINSVQKNSIIIPSDIIKKSKIVEMSEKEKVKEENKIQSINSIHTFDSMPNILNMVQIDELLKLIDKDKISNSDYLIILLLFGGVDNQFFKIDSVSSFLHINKEYITNIYIKCLKLYKDKLDNEIQKEKSLVLNDGSKSYEN